MAHERYRRQTDRQTTDGRAIAYSEREREFTYSEREREFTFAKDDAKFAKVG